MDFIVKKNNDDVFMRNIIVALSKFLYDVIKIVEVKDGEEILKTVKIFYGSVDQQYLSDMFLDPHQYEWLQDDLTEDDYKKIIEGQYRKVPYGVFTFESAGLQPNQMSGGYERAEFVMDVENEMGISTETFSARTNFVPEQFNVNLEIKASSEIERMKIYDVFIEKLWKANMFYFRYKGFQGLPCTVTFPENAQMEKNLSFKSNANDKLPMMKLSLKLDTVRPIIDETTIMMKKNQAKVTFINTKVVIGGNGTKKYPINIVPSRVEIKTHEQTEDFWAGEEI